MVDSGKFETLLHRHTYNHADVGKAFAITEQFIKDNNCILSGGMAIDANLRVMGDHIYALDTLPDYDPWSPDAIELAEKLAQMLCLADIKDVTVSNAYHITTRVVNVGASRVCELTYIPTEIYRRIPTIQYAGFTVRSAHHQMCDMLFSISCPLYDYPNETYGRRLVKDMTRFNKMLQYYPFECGPVDLHERCGEWREFVVPDNWGVFCVAGIACISGITAPGMLTIVKRTVRYRIPAECSLLLLLHDVPPQAVLFRGSYIDSIPAVYAIDGIHVSENMKVAGCAVFGDAMVTIGYYELACVLTAMLYEPPGSSGPRQLYKSAFDTLYKALCEYGSTDGAYGSPLTLSGISATMAKDSLSCVAMLKSMDNAMPGKVPVKYRPDMVRFKTDCSLPIRAAYTPLYAHIDYQLAQ